MKHSRQNHMKAKHQSAQEQDAIRANLERENETETHSADSHSADVDVPEKIEAKSEGSLDGVASAGAETKNESKKNEADEIREIFQETLSNLTETVNHAKETFAQARHTIEVLKGTAGKVMAHLKQNPEPFIASTVPGLIGLYLLVQKVRKN